MTNNIRCHKCKTERDISLFSWMSGKSRPMVPVGVCDVCLGLRPEPLVEEADNPEEQAKQGETGEEA